MVYHIGGICGAHGGKKYKDQPFTPTCRERSIHLDIGMYEEFKTVLCNICDKFFSIGEDGFRTRRMTRFFYVLGRHTHLEGKFKSLGDYTCSSNAEYNGSYNNSSLSTKSGFTFLKIRFFMNAQNMLENNCHFVRDVVLSGLIATRHVLTHTQLADIMGHLEAWN